MKNKSDSIIRCILTKYFNIYFQLSNTLVINVNDKNFYLNSLHIETYVLDPTSRLFPLIVTIVFPCRGPNVGLIEYTSGTYQKKLIGKILMYFNIETKRVG